MRRIKTLFAVLVMAAIIAVVPAASATTVHFAGAGSSAQWQEAALAAFNLAQGIGNGVLGSGTGSCTYHFTAKGNNADLNPAVVLVDNRNANIPQEPGNIWVVWVGDCNATNPGTTNVTDIWLDASVDSTVGVRSFFASTKNPGTPITYSQGVQVNVDTSARSGSDAIASTLWNPNGADTLPLPAAVSTAINAGGGVRVNVGLTDIRPEDALFASNRALTTVNKTTYAGLGYNKGPVLGIGNSIYSTVATTSIATPVKFALSGTDPLGKGKIAAYATLPIGAAPIIFVSNNGGTTPLVTDIEDGAGGPINGDDFPLAHLFDGTTACDTHSSAFGGNADGAGTTLTLFLREPLSGTMNTFEFTEVRVTGNTSDSQEKGVTSTTTAPFNPMNLACPTHGFRKRGIGTGDIVTGVTGTSDSLGYIFFSFGNASKFTGTKYNYLTLDGVDPLSIPGTVQQELPNCPNCTEATVWGTGNLSYPHLRDGTYRAWSIYRWVGEPGTPSFCANNASTNPVAACLSVAATPTKLAYNNTTGVATVTFGAAVADAVGEGVVISGATGAHVLYNGSYKVTKVTNTATLHTLTYQLATGLHLTIDSTDTLSAVLNPPTDAYGVQALAQAAQDGVEGSVADFVPFNPTTGGDGLNVYRAHNNVTVGTVTFTANDGPLVTSGSNETRGGGSEAGGDVGGCIVVSDTPSDETGCKQ